MEHIEDKPLFVIDDDPRVEWPVTVRLPEAGGTYGEYRFMVTMRVLSPDEYEKLLQSSVAPADAAATPMSEQQLSGVMKANVPIFQRLITGWSGIKNRDGADVAFSPDVLAAQISGPRGPALSVALWNAISEVRFGTHLTSGERLGN